LRPASSDAPTASDELGVVQPAVSNDGALSDHERAKNPWPASDRRSRSTIGERSKSLTPVLVAWLFGALVIGAVALQGAVAPEVLLLDAATASGGRWYVGAVTSLGVLAWATATGGLAVAGYVSRLAQRSGATRAFTFGAVLLALLMFDDLFLFHSDVGPHILGIPKNLTQGIEASVAAYWVFRHRSELARTRWELLLAAGGAFGVSLGIDVTGTGQDPSVRIIAEDGAKFCGLLALAVWSVLSATTLLRSLAVRPPQ
jgi:hypothetical protein